MDTMDTMERALLRWQRAGLLDEATAGAIRAYERGQVKPAGQQWQVRLALILGGILLGAGVLLFVAAHWETISPTNRTLLVLAMVMFAHGLGVALQGRFAGMATAMHAIGTVTAGAAIALVGQIYNMQEHWPAAVLLWALCAAAGWALLRDEFQQTLTLLLVPAWVVAEWTDRAQVYGGNTVYLARVGAVLGVVYLVAFLRSRRRALFGIVFSVGALLLPISIGSLADGWNSVVYGGPWGFVPMRYRVAAVMIMAAIGVCGALVERHALLPAVVVGGLVWALPWCRTVVRTEAYGGTWEHGETSAVAYLLVAAGAIFLVWWGVERGSKALVNYGTVAFAMTVFWFYFASVMDKLGRSLGLIALGVLFLVGGWALERGRRRLMSRMEEDVSKRVRGLLLLGLQLLLVLSVLGKYAYERKTRPRIWVRATGVDPDRVLRGQYLALRLLVDGCALPKGAPESFLGLRREGSKPPPRTWRWRVRLEAEKGRLMSYVEEGPRALDELQSVQLREGEDCGRARLLENVDYFVPERARSPLPLKAGEELWVEVTVPPSGPPRPIQLATAGAGGWRVLRFE